MLCSIGGLLLLLLVAQFSPGISPEWRPYARFRMFQAERLFERARAAEQAGDKVMARLGFQAALEVHPAAVAPRVRLARLLAEEGDLDASIKLAATFATQGEGSVFVHDALLHAGRHPELVHLALRGLRVEPHRFGVWLMALKTGLLLCDPVERAALAPLWTSAVLDPQIELWSRAVRAAVDNDPEAARLLKQLSSDPTMNAERVLAGLDLWLRLNRPDDGWVWLSRHRQKLSPFDSLWADLRLEQARDPALAARLLAGAGLDRLDGFRLRKIVALFVPRMTPEAHSVFLSLANEARQMEPAVRVMLWAGCLAAGDETGAAKWAALHRAAGGRDWPMLAGRALADPDFLVRWRAARLLAVEIGLPREALFAFAEEAP